MTEDSNKIKAIELRIESLNANRNFFTALFTIESVVLGLFVAYIARFSIASSISLALIFSSVIIVLLGIFSLTDSLHSYSKYIEYQYAWDDQVHKKAYPESDKTKKSVSDGCKALEADDIGYYFLKLSLIAFFYFLASLILNVHEIGVGIRYFLFFSFIALLTHGMIYTYKTTHRKTYREAIIDFFVREKVIKEGK